MNLNIVVSEISMNTAVDSTSVDLSPLARASDVNGLTLAADSLGDEKLSSATVQKLATARLELERELRQAFEGRQFVLHYQPIVSLASGELEGFEALLRWNNPLLGLVAPDDFIPCCEETGLIVPVGFWVMTEACRQLKKWQRQFPSFANLRMSVNLSARQLSAPVFVQRVRQILDDTGVDPQCLILEITESMMIQNTDSIVGILSDLQALGIQLELDDFGMGYSSLSFLHRPPPNGIKVDRSFVQCIGHRRDGAIVIHAIIALAHDLGLTLVAEGIETWDQLAVLQSLGCEKAQGFYLSKPMPAADAEAYIGKIAAKNDDNQEFTGTISQYRFFGEAGPSRLADDPIPPLRCEKSGAATDGQIIETGMPPRCCFSQSNRQNLCRRKSPCPSCALATSSASRKSQHRDSRSGKFESIYLKPIDAAERIARGYDLFGGRI